MGAKFQIKMVHIRIQGQIFEHLYLVAPLAHCCEEARYVLRVDGKLPYRLDHIPLGILVFKIIPVDRSIEHR